MDSSVVVGMVDIVSHPRRSAGLVRFIAPLALLLSAVTPAVAHADAPVSEALTPAAVAAVQTTAGKPLHWALPVGAVVAGLLLLQLLSRRAAVQRIDEATSLQPRRT